MALGFLGFADPAPRLGSSVLSWFVLVIDAP
jgi:hypothetical protein